MTWYIVGYLVLGLAFGIAESQVEKDSVISALIVNVFIFPFNVLVLLFTKFIRWCNS